MSARRAAGRGRCAVLAVGALLALGGCKRANMYSQGKLENWDRSGFFPNGQSMRLPVAGTLPRDEPNAPVVQPATITAALVARGHERFEIFCTPCHGRAGDGEGMIVQRGFPRPPDFASTAMRQISAQRIYDTLTYGYGAMYSYSDRVPPADRWAIAGYIRALQASRGTAVADLGEADRARLADAPVELPPPPSVQDDVPIGSTEGQAPVTRSGSVPPGDPGATAPRSGDGPGSAQ